jgi:hypothetical protein
LIRRQGHKCPTKMKNYFQVLAIVLGIAIAGCQPDPDELKLYDDLVVSTNYDPSAAFSEYTTYTLPTDTIGFVSNQTNDTLLTHAESTLVRPLIERVRMNLDQSGLTRVDKGEDPDIGMNILIVNNLNLFQQVIDPGYYYPYYYGYSSYYYYPYVQTYVENTATLVLQMVDLKNRNSNNQVKVVWTAQMGDVVSTIDRVKQCEEAIDQAFVQSPYLKSVN